MDSSDLDGFAGLQQDFATTAQYFKTGPFSQHLWMQVDVKSSLYYTEVIPSESWEVSHEAR